MTEATPQNAANRFMQLASSASPDPAALSLHLQHRIVILCYPPNATAQLQPLDVSLHGPLKQEAARLHADLEAEGVNIDTEVYINRVIYPAWLKTFSSSNIKAGFKKAGIWPFNRQAVSDTVLQAAQRLGSKSLSLPVYVEQQRAAAADSKDGVALPQLQGEPPAYVSQYLDVPMLDTRPKKGKRAKAKQKPVARMLNEKTFLKRLQAKRAKQAARGAAGRGRAGHRRVKSAGSGKRRHSDSDSPSSDEAAESSTDSEADSEEDSPPDPKDPTRAAPAAAASGASASSSSSAAANGSGAVQVAPAAETKDRVAASPAAAPQPLLEEECPKCFRRPPQDSHICCHGCGVPFHLSCAGQSRRKKLDPDTFYCGVKCRVRVMPAQR